MATHSKQKVIKGYQIASIEHVKFNFINGDSRKNTKKNYKTSDDVDMYIIYIGEAHPSDGWNLRKSYYADQPSYPKHKSMIERLNVAKDFENTVKSITTVPIFVDNFENKTDEFFIALPGIVSKKIRFDLVCEKELSSKRTEELKSTFL